MTGNGFWERIEGAEGHPAVQPVILLKYLRIRETSVTYPRHCGDSLLLRNDPAAELSSGPIAKAES